MANQLTAATFDSIFDTDIGVIKVMLDKYANPKFIDNDLLKMSTIREDDTIKYLLALRVKKNPLTAILKPEYIESADDLYDQVFKENFQEIIDKSQTSAIYKVVRALMDTNSAMDFYVICEAHVQVDILNKLDSRLKTVILPEENNYKCFHDYDNIFVKDFTDMLRTEFPVTKKNIYLSRLMFNMSPVMGEFVPRMDINVIVGRTNKIMLIDYYENLKSIKIPQQVSAEDEAKG